MLVGSARVSVQAFTLPSLRTRKGRPPWSVLTWKPVTLPTAWQGSSGQDGSGVVAVLPSTTVVRELVAAPAPVAIATRAARQAASPIATAIWPRAAIRSATPALWEDLDMPVLLS